MNLFITYHDVRRSIRSVWPLTRNRRRLSSGIACGGGLWQYRAMGFPTIAHRVTLALLVLLATLGQRAVCDPINYYLSAVTTHGMAASGYLAMDGPQIESFSFNVSVIGSSFGGSNFDIKSGNDLMSCSPCAGNGAAFLVKTPATIGYNGQIYQHTLMVLSFTTGFPGQISAGSYLVCPSCFGSKLDDGPPSAISDDVQSGSVVLATPEPPTWVLSLAGLLLLGGVVWFGKGKNWLLS